MNNLNYDSTESDIDDFIDPHHPEYFWCEFCGKQQPKGLFFCRFCTRAVVPKESNSGSISGFSRSRQGPREYLSSASFRQTKQCHQMKRTSRELTKKAALVILLITTFLTAAKFTAGDSLSIIFPRTPAPAVASNR